MTVLTAVAKTLNESPLTTRNARDKLSRGTHWRAIDPDVHLGYRKGVRGGRWLVRWYGGQQKYRQATLGTADDAICEGALSFEAAAKRAREHVSNYRRAVRGVSGGAAPTLRIPVEQYIAMRDARDRAREQRPIRSDASRRLGRYILDDPIADLALHELTDAALRAWRKRLNPKLAHTTTQRLSSDLKAALNAYYLENRKKLPADFAETVRVGLKTPSQEIPAEPKSSQAQMLTDEQVRAVVQAAIEQDVDGDFGRLILVMASTGARFAQVRRLRVEDVQPEFARIMMPASRKGKPKATRYIAVRVGPDILAALKPVIDGRDPTEPLLCRWRHIQISPTQWQRVSRGPWYTPSEMLRPWRAACAKAGVPGKIPYALRHSSIVRAIRTNLPIRLVAALHDTSVTMIERHYGRWITEGLEELAAQAIIPIVPCGQAGEEDEWMLEAAE
ncbi:tyrosine-type recombinase/integrase [Sphingomonas flavalba]|uniref:tyrosine-type recombinase/integrase n=1 Tax=Sphingomonas flavalba TaxID=2559804 RepID=UPI0039E0FEE0